MAALLNVDALRQHALPPAFMVDLDHATGLAPAAARPCLIAAWRLGPDGRPVCHWTMDAPAIRVIPPD